MTDECPVAAIHNLMGSKSPAFFNIESLGGQVVFIYRQYLHSRIGFFIAEFDGGIASTRSGDRDPGWIIEPGFK